MSPPTKKKKDFHSRKKRARNPCLKRKGSHRLRLKEDEPPAWLKRRGRSTSGAPGRGKRKTVESCGKRIKRGRTRQNGIRKGKLPEKGLLKKNISNC